MKIPVQQLGRVGVVMGGCSSEREISLKSGKAVLHALQDAGCDVVAVELNTIDENEILTQLAQLKVDIVFLALHGKFGEDGTIQAIFEKAGIVYTGSGSQPSRLAMDKAETQILLKKNGVSVPEFFILDRKNESQSLALLEKFGGCPVVVKPACEGSSIGITIVRRPEDFEAAVVNAFEFGPRILVDRYLSGKEITSGILGGEALALIEIRSKNKFFDFTAKYQKGMSDYIVPAEISPEQARRIQEMSQIAFKVIGCRDMARSDFILDEMGNVYFLEINTIPGFTATSLLPMAAQNKGLNFTELCLTIAGFAAARKRELQYIQKVV
ncbi:MAG: D-alanine--D-alanine ligase [Candidatus Omnitrophica bacterium]|nr:D-alanine--D-alanine ligase [Candidatus Omnitrophota bacterium]